MMTQLFPRNMSSIWWNDFELGQVAAYQQDLLKLNVNIALL